MGALFYGNLDEVRSTEQDWFDDEEFDELQVDPKQFDVNITLTKKSELDQASRVFISFLERPEQSKRIASNLNLQLIGTVTSKFLNGNVYKLANDVVWFRLSSMERLPSRSFTSKQIERLCAELFPKYLTAGQSICLLSQQPSYDHPFEFYTSQPTDELREHQKQLPIMFTRASEGLLFEYCIKNQRKIQVLKLPMLLDEVTGLRNYLPGQLYSELATKNNYLESSSNLYA